MSPEHGPKAPTSFHGVRGQRVKRNLEPRLVSGRLNWGTAAEEAVQKRAAAAACASVPRVAARSSLPRLPGSGMTAGLVCASGAVVAITGRPCVGHLAVVLAHKYSKV